MALTPDEQAELQQLEEEERQRKFHQQGSDAVALVQNQQPTIPPGETRPFSVYRATVGALRDAAQGAMDLVDDVGDTLQKAVPLPSPVFGSDASNGIIGLRSAEDTTRAVESTRALGELPHLRGEEQAGAPERIIRGIGSFMVPFLGASKLVGVMRGASWLGRAGRAMLAGGLADLAQVDPISGNMANTLRDVFGIHNDVLDSLATEQDDDKLWARFKAAAVNAPVGLAADAVMEAGFRAVKAYRAWKGTADEAAEAVNAVKSKNAIEPYRAPVEQADQAAADGAKAAEDAAFWHVPPEYNPARDASARPQPQSFEDVLDYLKRQAEAPDIAEEDFKKFAENLLFGDPENALAKLGIDPAKLDFRVYDNPELLGRLQKGLAEVYEVYASKLGRSNLRISEQATLRAARALATSADVLKDVHGATRNLAEQLTAARLFVGAHAHALLSHADAAIKEITSGVSNGPAWTQFLESFHRHAYYLGVVRGAGTEVGRALRSLQIIGRVSDKQAARTLGEALKEDAKSARTLNAVKSEVEQGASDFEARLGTDAEKLDALRKLKELGGDVGELTMAVRREANSPLKRLGSALRETVGSLFGPATALRNMMAGGSMLGLKVLSKAMSTITAMSLSPFSSAFSREARIRLMDTWAYTDGIITGFRAATHAALSVLEKEGMAEVAHNLDGLGFKDLALKAANQSAEASDELALQSASGRTFERTDVKSQRAYGVTASENRALMDKIDSMDGPSFFTAGLKGLVRIGASAINAAGSLTRSGTILFINLPDQFVGTLAARAGAYSKAVRIAASEAAELSLEGKDLSTYLKARTRQLIGDGDVGWHEDPFWAGERQTMAAHGEAEAREVLFQDDLETTTGRALQHGLGKIPGISLFVPFIKTPLRILERTALDYTPLGLVKDRVRRAIMAGGAESDEAMARMALGTIALVSAYNLAGDRRIVGNDGGLASSARLSRPSYTLRIGDDQVEFNYIDPLGTILGFGADLRAFMDRMEGDPEAPGKAQQAAEAFLWATTANILSKTWLTGLKNLTALTGATGDEQDLDARFTTFVSQFAARFVPASGAQRQIEKALDGHVRNAVNFTDGLFKASLGAEKLPVKRDTILGRPVPEEGMDRLVGIKAAPRAGNEDPLLKELENLSFDLPSPRRTVMGVKLNGTQFSRYLELRGQVMKKPDTGLNLEQTLNFLIHLPEYQQMTRYQRVDAIRQEMQGFSQMATDQLLREDKDFAYRALRAETWKTVQQQGGDSRAADEQTRRFAAQLGLTPTH